MLAKPLLVRERALVFAEKENETFSHFAEVLRPVGQGLKVPDGDQSVVNGHKVHAVVMKDLKLIAVLVFEEGVAGGEVGCGTDQPGDRERLGGIRLKIEGDIKSWGMKVNEVKSHKDFEKHCHPPMQPILFGAPLWRIDVLTVYGRGFSSLME